MTVFHFGDAEAPMLGVLHQAARRAPAGVVLCPPLGGELVQGHRVLRHVADAVAAAGWPVLRFDYRGTGDAAGHDAMVSRATLREDTTVAVDELLDTTGARRAVVVGVRLGAMPALDTASDPRVQGVVLWDAVTDGSALVTEWRQRAIPGPDNTQWVDGVPHSAQWLADVTGWRFDATLQAPAVREVTTPARWGAIGPDGWLQVPGAALTNVVTCITTAASE
jgi:uncharacterized protein